MAIKFKGDTTVAIINSIKKAEVDTVYRCFDSGILLSNEVINHGDFVSWDGTKWIKRPDLSYVLDNTEHSVESQIEDIQAVIPEGTSKINTLVNMTQLNSVKNRVATLETNTSVIENKIPSNASSSNKLVTSEDLENATSELATGYTPKGNASVSDINSLETQSNGDMYVVTDSGTITAGALEVTAGDSVAWDSENEVWYFASSYVTKTEFEAYRDALDGTAKSDSITSEYDGTTGVGEGEYCMNEGQLYQADSMLSGDFDSSKCTKKEVYEVLLQQIEQQKLMISALSTKENLERPSGYIPDVGDSLWVDGEGGKHFYKGDTVNGATLAAAGFTFVGVVALKRGRKVTVLNNSETVSVRFASAWAWEITGVAYGESNTIQFQQRGLTSEGATTYTDYEVGSPLTFTPTDIDDAVEKIDEFLRENQGGKSFNPLIVCNYHWHCTKINDKIWVVADFGTGGNDGPSYRQYEGQVVKSASSGSISSSTNMWELAGYSSNSTSNQRADGVTNGTCLWNESRAKQYMSVNGNIGIPTDSLTSTGIYSETNWDSLSPSSILKTTYETYNNYLNHMLLKYPAVVGALNVFAGTAKEACDAMEQVTYTPFDGGDSVNMFSAVHFAKTLKAHPTASVDGMNAGDWYIPGLDEAFGIFSKMKTDGSDVINTAFIKSNSQSRVMTLSRYTPNRCTANSGWLLSNTGSCTNGYFIASYGVSAVATLEY